MTTRTPDEIEATLANHGLWLRSEGGSHANLTGAALMGAKLTGADLMGINLTCADLTGADLMGVNLTCAYLIDADLMGAGLARANLTSANLTDACLRGVCLRGADLTRANLIGADLARANLTGVKLTDASLARANLMGVNLTGADLTGADLYCTIGNMREIRSMQIDTWPVAYTAEHLQIGCQRHAIDKWREWATDAGRKWLAMMHGEALAWADLNLALVLQIIDAKPATPTGHEKEATE